MARRRECDRNRRTTVAQTREVSHTALESDEARTERLGRRRELDRLRRATETDEERDARFA